MALFELVLTIRLILLLWFFTFFTTVFVQMISPHPFGWKPFGQDAGVELEDLRNPLMDGCALGGYLDVCSVTAPRPRWR